MGQGWTSDVRGEGLDWNLPLTPGCSLMLRCVISQDPSKGLASESVLSLRGWLRAQKEN